MGIKLFSVWKLDVLTGSTKRHETEISKVGQNDRSFFTVA